MTIEAPATLPKVLYHGTRASLLPKIMREGLRSRGRRAAVDAGFSSNPDAVYLTDAFAFKFALDACAKQRKPWKLLILEIDVSKLAPERLTVDDDFLADHLYRASTARYSMKEAVERAQETLPDFATPGNVQKSLQWAGSCAYLAPVPPSAISRAFTIEYEVQQRFCLSAWDVSVGPAAYALTRPRHVARMQWLMNKIEPEPIVARSVDDKDGAVRSSVFTADDIRRLLALVPDSRDGIEEVDLARFR